MEPVFLFLQQVRHVLRTRGGAQNVTRLRQQNVKSGPRQYPIGGVGWLPNRSGVDYSVVTDKVPAYGAFVDYPEDYKFFTLPAIGPIEEVLTRLAAQLTNAYSNPVLAEDDAAIDAVLAKAAEETNNILKREGLLAE